MPELKSILIAEDNPKDLELTLEALSDHNLANDIVAVAEGAEALDYLFRRGKYEGRGHGDPAVILLDIKMPKVDGLEVLRTIKRDARLKTIPVVMLTSSREERDLVDCYELGVNAYVVKPVQFMEFIESVKQIGAFWGILNESPHRRKDF
ncbi:MAG TPA: response regulator [Bryobacteraceae bacterium]|nr:response regulator [Bryobacteraceae bacterium]